MMKEFFLILKFLLKQNFTLKHFIHGLKENKRQRNLFIVVGVILALSLPSLGAFIFIYIKLYDALAAINQQSFFLVIAIIFSAIVIILLAMFQVTSYFYFANDVKILTPLPIKTRHILLSKFIVVYIWELIISFFTVFPFFLIYGIKGNIDILAWINLMVSFILLPIIPLVLIGIFVVLIMKATNLFKNRDAIRMVGMLLTIVILVGFQMYMQSMAMSIPEGQESEFIQRLIENNAYLIDQVKTYYPIIPLVINSIIGGSLFRIISILLFGLISMVSIYIFSIILEKIYLKTYLTEQEQMTKNRKVGNLSGKSREVALSIMSVDMKTLFRVPIYAMNCLSTVIIIPVVLLISALSTGGLFEIGPLYEAFEYIIWFGVTLMIILIGPLNVISSTSFSREGKTNWIMRTLPISARDNINGRVLSALIVQVVFTIITVGIVLYIFKDGYFFGMLTIILSLVASVPLHLLGLYIDLKHPILKWDNPQVAVKQNMNVLIIMGVSMIYASVLVLIYLGFAALFTVNSLLAYFILYLIYLTLGFILSFLIYNLLEKQFEKSLVVME